jgi:hypothetical protein
MDIRIYFQKVREIESSIKEPFVVVASLETPDGGKAGTLTEVTPSVAARLVVEGKARLGNTGETSEYRERAERTRSEAEQVLAKSKMQFTLLTEQESKALRSARLKS